jgi:hypothetical protein
MAGDVYVTCTVSPCQIVHTIDLPPFQLDEAGGALVAAAIIGVWALGWAFRMLIRALRVDDLSPGSDGSDGS